MQNTSLTSDKELNILIIPREAKKTALFYFCNMFIKPLSILIIFDTHIYYDKFAIICVFYFFHKLKTGNQLKFQQCSALAHCSHTVFKLLYREIASCLHYTKTVVS